MIYCNNSNYENVMPRFVTNVSKVTRYKWYVAGRIVSMADLCLEKQYIFKKFSNNFMSSCTQVKTQNNLSASNNDMRKHSFKNSLRKGLNLPLNHLDTD